MTIEEIFKKCAPDIADEDLIMHIVWEHTGYPSFFGEDQTLESQIKAFVEKFPDGNCRGECIRQADAAFDEFKASNPKLFDYN